MITSEMMEAGMIVFMGVVSGVMLLLMIVTVLFMIWMGKELDN